MPLLDIYPREVKTMSHKNSHVNVCSAFTGNCPKVETIEQSSTAKQINSNKSIQWTKQ